jgi:hypothetical protein
MKILLNRLNINNMKQILLSVVVAFAAIQLSAQTVEWANHIGSASMEDYVYGLETASNGNHYLLGNTGGTIDADPSGEIMELTDESYYSFIECFGDDGSFKWAKKFGADNYCTPAAMAIDANDNLYVTGYFEDEVDFNPGEEATILTADGYSDMFVVKFNSNGELLWAKKFGGDLNGSINPKDIAVGVNNDVYITGYHDYKIQFDANVEESYFESAGDDDFFVLQLDMEGNYVWSFATGGEDYDEGLAIEVGTSGSVYIGGYFTEEVDFQPGSGLDKISCGEESNAFVVRYDTSLTLGGDRICALALDQDENIYLTGQFTGKPNFGTFYGGGDVTLDAHGYYELFAMKLNKESHFQWAKDFWLYTVSKEHNAYDIEVDDRGNVYVAAEYNDKMKLWIFANADGETIHSASFNAWASDNVHHPKELTLSSAGVPIIAAEFESSIILNEDEENEMSFTAADGWDMIWFKYDSKAVGVQEIQQIEANIYPNPASENLNIQVEGKMESISVMSIDGRVVFTSGKVQTIDVSQWQQGLYLVNVRTNKGVASQQIVVE